jgi:hypothetical protein
MNTSLGAYGLLKANKKSYESRAKGAPAVNPIKANPTKTMEAPTISVDGFGSANFRMA